MFCVNFRIPRRIRHGLAWFRPVAAACGPAYRQSLARRAVGLIGRVEHLEMQRFAVQC
ncbi:hypothetical protein RSSM_06557 [Rhodopirellula sallentina SM41]|uniref:Uncharacterized protein n=1 Tax=Rhodopirellula sallentina SM41 TaxID=1263870 RepID=M5TS27_9BACT|nr:hypothetical protein RSSM_06557 [Rhodopirellula sallentina SM41]